MPLSISNFKKNSPIVFLLGVTISLLILVFLGASFRHQVLRDSKWNWMLNIDRIDDGKPIDGIFFGSSFIWLAINPLHIDKDKKYLNMGRSYPGRDADFVSIQEVLNRVKTKKIYLEIQPIEYPEPYLEWAHIRGIPEIVDELLNFRETWKLKQKVTWSDIQKHIRILFGNLGHWAFWVPLRLVFPKVPVKVFNVEDADETASDPNCQTKKCQWYQANRGYNVLTDAKNQDHKYTMFNDRVYLKKNTYVYDENSRYHFYLKKIVELCRSKDIELAFIFVPNSWGSLPADVNVRLYRSLGPVYIPDTTQLRSLFFWRDEMHMNRRGAEIFSKEVGRILKEGPLSSENSKRYPGIL